MTDQSQYLPVFIDLLPNQPKDDRTRESFRHMLRDRFEEKITDAVERIYDLPPLILKDPDGGYISLLQEARELFISGYFYSCVAMCGIVGERLVKDVLRTSVLIEKDGKASHPNDTAFNQLEHVEVNGIVRFLQSAELLSYEAAKAAENLGQLRNSYVHARGKEPQKDAIDAIRLLHTFVEGTISVFRDIEMKDGAFVRKTHPT